MSAPVVIASCADALGEDEDQPRLEAALADLGVDSVAWAWDDDEADWSAPELVVIRSTWDYAARTDAFCDWAAEVERLSRLANPASVVRWNTDKRYLAELDRSGVAVTPTAFFEPGDTVALPDAAEVVVKPTRSAGAKDTTRHRRGAGDEAALRAAGSLLATGRPVMVQPYLAGVDEHGETGLVYVDGRPHHAFNKGPILVEGRDATDRLYAPEQIRSTTPSEAERSLAEAALAAMPFDGSTLLYARVDVAPGPDGSPVLMELELVEPSLFLVACGRSAERLAAAVAARLRWS